MFLNSIHFCHKALHMLLKPETREFLQFRKKTVVEQFLMYPKEGISPFQSRD